MVMNAGRIVRVSACVALVALSLTTSTRPARGEILSVRNCKHRDPSPQPASVARPAKLELDKDLTLSDRVDFPLARNRTKQGPKVFLKVVDGTLPESGTVLNPLMSDFPRQAAAGSLESVDVIATVISATHVELVVCIDPQKEQEGRYVGAVALADNRVIAPPTSVAVTLQFRQYPLIAILCGGTLVAAIWVTYLATRKNGRQDVGSWIRAHPIAVGSATGGALQPRYRIRAAVRGVTSASSSTAYVPLSYGSVWPRGRRITTVDVLQTDPKRGATTATAIHGTLARA